MAHTMAPLRRTIELASLHGEVQRCTKGSEDPGTARTRAGDDDTRREGDNHQLAELGQEVAHITAELDLARTDLARTEEHRDAVLQQADRLQQDLLAFRSRLHSLRQRARQACALVLCLSSFGGFAVG